MRKVAFCFHHAEASGASLWLQKFLLNDPWPKEASLAIFPGPSPMRRALEDAHLPCAEVLLNQVALSSQSFSRKISLLAERMRSVYQYRRLFRQERIEVVYVNSSVQIAPMLAARSLGLRLVVHVREAWRSGATFPIKKIALRRLADGALFDAQLGMQLFGGEPKGARWVFSPNGVAPHSFDEARRARTRAALGLAPEQTLVLFLGSMIQRKGVHDMAECWPAIAQSHPGTVLILAGLEEKSETHPSIRRMIAGEVPGTRFIGFRPDVYDLLEAADLFLLPSYGEAMPISICEAMMVGTPVIARTVGDVEWLLREGRGYPFSGDGAAPLKATIETALADPKRREKAVAAQAFAKERLHRDIQKKQIRDLLQSI